MINSEQILNYLSSNKARFKEDYHVIRIGLFGSMAYGGASEKSDIDIIIEFEENTSGLFEIKQQLKTEIQKVFDRPVDICREKYIKPFLRDRILGDVQYA